MTEQRKEDLKNTSTRIQEVLESSGFALQPFMQFSEFGIMPRVRLVDVTETKDEPGNNTEEVSGGADTDTTTEPEQSQDAQ